MKKLIAALLACLLLAGCVNNEIPPEPVTTEDVAVTLPDASDSTTASLPLEDDVPGYRGIMAEFAGSFLTMPLNSSQNSYSGSYVKVFSSYAALDSYFTSTGDYFMYGKKFISTLVSYDDIFFSSHDLMLMKLDEPSSYITHQVVGMHTDDGKVIVKLERHMPSDAPMTEAQYHLVFIAPKGTFAGLEDMAIEAEATYLFDSTAPANDSEAVVYSYPDYVPFVYRSDATQTPSTVIDSITDYDGLIGFYEKYKDIYDLSKLKSHIGILFDESVFEDYTLLAIITPSAENTSPEIGELFVYNRQIYIIIKNTQPAVLSDSTPCHLLIAAVSNKDLKDVDLKMFNIAFQ